MPSPLFDATLRLKWAEEEISQLDAAIRRHFVRHPCTIAEDRQSKPGRVLYRATLNGPIPTDDWKRSVTRIVSDLRDPLDYATVAVAQNLHAEKADFFILPIEDSEASFEREVKKRKIEARCPQLATFLRAIKPYKGPNNLIFALNEISGPNKHRNLTPIGMSAQGVAFKGTIINAGGLIMGNRWQPAENGFVAMDLSVDSKIDGKIQAAFTVALSEAQGFEREPITIVLMQMRDAVDNILSQFERQFFGA